MTLTLRLTVLHTDNESECVNKTIYEQLLSRNRSFFNRWRSIDKSSHLPTQLSVVCVECHSAHINWVFFVIYISV